MAYADQVIRAESGGNAAATNSLSSSAGLGGFIDRTWLDTIKKHRPDLAAQYSPQQLLAMRSDEKLSREMIDALGADNSAILISRGLPVNAGTVYLAHFAGPQGAASILSADDAAPASSVMSPAAMKVNPFLAKMTVGDLKAWAVRKMGGQTAAPTQAAAPGTLTNQQGQSPAGVPTSAPPDETQQAETNNALAQIPALLAKAGQPQQMQDVPAMQFNFRTPPGIERARALIRAMIANPVGSPVA